MTARRTLGAIAVCILALAVGAAHASARVDTSMRLTCLAPGKTTLSRIPSGAAHFRFTFWWTVNGKSGKVVSGPAWYDRSLVKHNSLWIYTMSRFATHAMATVRMKNGAVVNVHAACA